MTVAQTLLDSPAGLKWKTIGLRHHHGVCLPLFSLHSQTSGGIGEYLDLIPMIRWCKTIGMDVIQLLPLNDTGQEPGPYNAISSVALNPIHLSLHALPFFEKVPSAEEKLAHLRQWNTSYRVNYSLIRDWKASFLWSYYQAVFSDFSQSNDYQTFLKNNRWVEPYGLFKALKESQGWRSWEEWPAALKNPSPAGYEALMQEYLPVIQFHSFLQYFCYQQFLEVRAVAEKEGVLLKGDVPILIARDSADVWYEPSNFLLEMTAGAPPDTYSDVGQNWGSPIYNWDALKKKNYQWWKDRLGVAGSFYQLYRIDHVVGFYRIWTIPSGSSPQKGAFLPADQALWIPHGEEIMKMMLESSPMLPIGEDLGVVPKEVRKSLAQLGICGTKVMRWERRWETDKGFIPVGEYSPISMTTVSTHDSDTLQEWWKHSPKEAKEFADYKKWPYEPFLSKEHHQEILRDSHHSGSLFHINLLQEYLALFPELISKNLNDERINIPGKVLATNWTYRFKPSVEEITQHTALQEVIKALIA